ncbi:hypothetical protein [Laspinema olomoucense]|uniref:Uncharacterized protein n=1 Tax=Laspinema olomoucense D3b TaxID=2953688 RepID=A0ABT2NCA4_9CYAN|nr:MULTISPECIES: hypothetical protein [unclassified Laspinema]MCT7980116.1 hypothetical protein [Laspinema sp. D3b]MCT7996365.1 hypothetical protein [Laspinema sp. D3c]
MILLQLFNQFLGKTAGGLWGQSTAIGCKLQTAPITMHNLPYSLLGWTRQCLFLGSLKVRLEDVQCPKLGGKGDRYGGDAATSSSGLK